MKKAKKSYSAYTVLSVIFIILYIILAAKPLSKENQYIPEWKLPAAAPAEKGIIKADGEKSHFKLGNEIGYFSYDGRLLLKTGFEQRAAISDFYYAPYTLDSQSVIFFDSDGNKKGTIAAPGFPFFSEDRIYLFEPGGASFSKCAEDGTIEWTDEGIMPITAFASRPDYTAAGYADGTIRIFSNQSGSTQLSFSPKGSDFPVIMGLDISSDAQFIATVCGRQRQRFVIAQNDTQPKIIFHTYLDNESTQRAQVKICEENGCVYYYARDFVGVYNLATRQSSKIPVKDRILDIQEAEGLVFMLGNNGREYTVYIIEDTSLLSGSFSVTADSCFIKAAGGRLYVGRDDAISCIRLAKE